MRESDEHLGPAAPPVAIRWAPVVLAGVAIAIVLLALWPRRQASPYQPPSGPKHPAVGTQIKQIAFQPLTSAGEELDIANVRGKITLINFWGPWCGPCGIEFPHLVELQRRFRDREDFLFLSVSCSGGPGDETGMRASTEAFLKQQKAEFPTYRDAEGATRQHLMQAAGLGGVEDFAFPTTVILDREAKIIAMWQGYALGDELTMLDVVETALKAK